MFARVNSWSSDYCLWSCSSRPFVPPRRAWIKHGRNLVKQINLLLDLDQPIATAYLELCRLMKKYGRDHVLREAGLPLADHLRWGKYAAIETTQRK